MKLVYRTTDQSPAYVEAYVSDEENGDRVDVDLPYPYNSMTVSETIDLIDNLVEALRYIAKSYNLEKVE